MRLPPLLFSLLSSKQDADDAIGGGASSTSGIIHHHHKHHSSAVAIPCSATPCSSSSSATTATDLPQSQTCKAYRQLKRECLRHGQLFVDKEFPPTNESLFLDEKSWNGTDLDIEWKRPGDIVDNPKLFVEGASPFDVTQGILGNCWFVSACSALTHNEALLQKVIPDAQKQEWAPGNEYAGIFQFCFWRFGRWVDVMIDDYLPTKDGKLLFARSKTPNEFWSALLEKAFAKLYGCYENLVGGQLADALQDVSGGIAECLNLQKFLRQYQQQQQQQTGTNNNNGIGGGGHRNRMAYGRAIQITGSRFESSKRLFHTLKHAFDREALIVAAIAAKKEEVEKSLDCGLVMGHAYAITAIRYIELDAAKEDSKRLLRMDHVGWSDGAIGVVKRQAMVRLQNPWGEKEWNGPWSDGSVEWEQVTEQQKCQLGITVDEDGEFWMPWEEFIKYFTDISVCQLLNTESLDPRFRRQMSVKASRRSNATIGMPDKQYREWTFFGRWSNNSVKSCAPKDRAGGCPNFPASFCYNPQFLFDVPNRESAEVMLALSQKDDFIERQTKMGGGSGWKKRGGNGKQRRRGKERKPYLVIGLYLMQVETNRQHRIHRAFNPIASSELSTGRSVYLHISRLQPGRYILLPTTYAPGEEGEFMLRIYSSLPLNPVELIEDMPRSDLLSRCHLRQAVSCVVRVRIMDVEIIAAQEQQHRRTPMDLFCRLKAGGRGGGEWINSQMLTMEPDETVAIIDECFLFHGRGADPWQRFTLELVEQQKPFRHRDKCLGRVDFRVPTDQNDTLLMELRMVRMKGNDKWEKIGIGSNSKKSGEEGDEHMERQQHRTPSLLSQSKMRLEVSCYDDPFYL